MSNETFRAVELLDLGYEMNAWCAEGSQIVHIYACGNESVLTVAEFRKLIEWGLRALPCEHMRAAIRDRDGVITKHKCYRCGETLP